MMDERKMPEISVIVPVYNVERYLNECIDSILAQTFADLELILVDDGSPDGCPALCDAAAERDARVRVIHQQNRGLSGARNAGLDIARGNWIAFVDSDDKIQPRFLEKLYHTAVSAGAEAAMCGTYGMNEDGVLFPGRNGKGYDSDEMVFDEVLPRQEALNRLPMSAFQVSWNKLYRADIFCGIRFPEGKRHEDTFTSPRIYQKIKKLACTSENLYVYRIVQGSIMHSRITLQSLDRVEAGYQMFCILQENQCCETLCLAYRMILTSFADIWLHLTQEQRRAPRVQECRGFLRDAWDRLRQAHGITWHSLWDTLVYSVSPQKYLASRRRRLSGQKNG